MLRGIGSIRWMAASTASLTALAAAIPRWGGYAIEGHVPAADIKRLLAERPKARGLAVPGMPRGSPGMESDRKDPYDVMLILPDGSRKVYASHR